MQKKKERQPRAEKCTAREQRFVDEYIKDLNGTRAATRAGYSPNGADVQAVRLLGRARVQTAIQIAKQRRANRVAITQDQVLAKLMQIELDAKRHRQHSVRVSAVKLLGRHIGMFGDELKVETGDRASTILEILKNRRAKRDAK